MCILFIYRDTEASADSYRLILASNRDEFFARPAKPAHYWEKYPHCLGGTDMEPGREGGTWLGISTNGRVGVTLNLRGETRNSDTPAEGRGFLITDYLTSCESTETYLNKLHKVNQDTQKYNPYTLVLVELKHLPDEILKTQSPQVYPDLSSVFVHSEKAEYGTRTHSILLVDGSGKMTFIEETLMPDRTWKIQNFKAFL